ncbi:tail protein [Caulobacter phage CcrColossus]|uniref:Putative tail protein n=1 Tax=Caulobacter phage CcrColossus TaxID=1211640 RepID=K4K665_9CAUD|nr:tail protein [Caulobacter phage CcrColossus]AFU87992.1 putative tail protein [Caulobacter phage CcrColossus]
MADPVSFVVARVAQVGVSYLFPSEGPRLKDLKVTASTYGAAIPWVFGLTRVPGNMIWAKPIREKKKKKMAGKGGFYNQYTYYGTFAMGLCMGPVKSILRIWADGKLIYDLTNGFDRKDQDDMTIKQTLQSAINNPQTVSPKYRIRMYMGDEEQLPDSAMEQYLGAGNAPAFRGMCYLMFDDVPLADFGNRFPQITAEVFVGSTENNAQVIPLTLFDGTTPIDTDYAPGEAIFDWERSFAYLRYDDTMAQINLRTSKQNQLFTNENFRFPDGGGLDKLLCAGRDSSLYVNFDSATGGTGRFARLDPYSLQCLAVKDYPSEVVAATTAYDNQSIEHVLTVSADGTTKCLKKADLSEEWSLTLPGSIFKVCARDADATGKPTFFVFHGDGGTNLYLARVRDGAYEDVWAGWAPDTTMPSAILWDSAVPGVIMFWHDGAAPNSSVAKWSEDSNSEVWHHSIVGYPDVFDGQSRLLNQVLAWQVDGRLFVIDTNTGYYRDDIVDPGTGEVNGDVGEIDWQDYLDRYPDVNAAYYAGGYEVAASPTDFAQWHYQHYGEDEGRTVTYIGDNQGQGFALPPEYAGISSKLQGYDGLRAALVCLDGIEGSAGITTTGVGVSVGTVIQRMLTEGGLTPAQMALDPLYKIGLRGYGWASGTDIKSIVEELKRLYLFDLVESEGIIVAIMRGNPDNGLGEPDITIPQNVLGSSSPEAMDFWQETRAQEADLPFNVTLAYMNWEQDYETGTARSQRISNPFPTMFSRQQLALEMNVVMTPTEAKVQANKILYAQWYERTQHVSRLPWAYLAIDPADIIQVHMNDGRSYIDRLHRTELGADFSIATESYSQDSGAYAEWEDFINGDGGAGTGTSIVDDAPQVSLPFILNTPLLRDQDDTGGSFSTYYVGLGNGSPGVWKGASLYRSTNNLDYDLIDSGASDVEWGTVIGKLPPPPASAFAVDWKTKLTILPAVSWFDVDSITDDDLWLGANACMVGDEVIQFRDVVENEDGTWTLSTLLRGRRGTEYACDNHVAGERFIFLDSNTIVEQGDLINSRGQARFFKGVGNGKSLQDATTIQIAYEPRDLMPYAPKDIRREFSTAGIEVSWSRRTRFGGNMVDGTGEVPLVEKSERYEAYVLSGPFEGDLSRGVAPTNYLHKYEVTEPRFTYNLLSQGLDSFNPTTDTLYVVIYQLSDAVGRGFPGVRAIPPYTEF